MASRPLQGIRVIEVAAWTFVPAAGAVLADWGADVIKIEPPISGDPQRGPAAGGMLPGGRINFIIEIPNRGKRSAGLDLRSDAGCDLLYEQMPNPITGAYRAADGRILQLVMLQSDRYWAALCELLERSDLAVDPRFRDAKARGENSAACVAELDREFGKRSSDECTELLNREEGPWAVHRLPIEIFDDEQVQANGFVRSVEAADGSEFDLVGNPVQFDETPPSLVRAPEMGEHTEGVLLELGFTWEQLAEWKDEGVVS